MVANNSQKIFSFKFVVKYRKFGSDIWFLMRRSDVNFYLVQNLYPRVKIYSQIRGLNPPHAGPATNCKLPSRRLL